MRNVKAASLLKITSTKVKKSVLSPAVVTPLVTAVKILATNLHEF